MKVDFKRLTWENYPSTETPINADNLNRLEEGVAGLYSDMRDIEEELDGGVGEYVTDWLNEHVDPVGSAVVVDNTLSIEGAAADAKKVGDEILGSKVVVDDTLTITGAAADAKKTGDELSSLKEDLTYVENDGLIVFPTNKIVRGSLSTSDGETVDTSQTSRVSTKQRLSYARDIVVTPDDGYRIYFYTFPQNVKTASGWMKAPYVITAGLEFTFTASKVSEAVVTDIGEMLTHFHVSTQVSDNTNSIENLNDLSVAFSNLGAVYTFADWIQGGLNPSEWYDNNYRICSAKYHKFNAGQIDLKCSAGFAPWCFVYDSDFNHIANYGDNGKNTLSVNTVNGYYYKFFVYHSTAITPLTDTGFSCTYKTALTEALEQNPLYYDWHIGNIQEGRTNITAPTVANEEEFIYARKGDVIKSDSSTSYYIKIVAYDNDRAWSNNDGSWVALPYTIASSGYIRIAIRTSDWASITDTILADIRANVSVCKSVFDSLADFNDEINDLYGMHFATNGDWTDDISDLQFDQGNKFTFAIQTDTHFSPKYQGENSITPLKVLTNSVGFDFIANLGDIIRGYQIDTLPEARESMTEAIRRYVEGVGCPALFAVGNHDNNVLWSVSYGTSSLNECILKDELTAKIIKPMIARTNIVRNGDSQYYYKDFDEVRVVMLNTRDIAYQEVALGDLDTNAHAISQEQCDWFSSVALDTDKQVLVMCHVPLVTDVSYDNILPTNASTILSALQTFISLGGTVIGCMYGHTHKQYKATVNGITHMSFADGGYFAEIVMVDTEAKAVSTKLVGNYTSNLSSRSYTY